jgi:hypothetical protein
MLSLRKKFNFMHHKVAALVPGEADHSNSHSNSSSSSSLSGSGGGAAKLDESENVLKEGFLEKRGGGTSTFGRQSWKRRFWRLTPISLSYYEDAVCCGGMRWWG